MRGDSPGTTSAERSGRRIGVERVCPLNCIDQRNLPLPAHHRVWNAVSGEGRSRWANDLDGVVTLTRPADSINFDNFSAIRAGAGRFCCAKARLGYAAMKENLLIRSLLAFVLLAFAHSDALSQTTGAGARDAVMPGAESAPTPAAKPGDRVVLKIWNEPEMSDTFTVAQSGNVILPRLGSVKVDGVAIVELEDSLRRAYTTYLRNPSVEVIVLRRISVLGEVRSPGIYLADLTMGLPEVIARAGGPTEIANERRVTVVRNGERIEFRGAVEEQIFVAELFSGDQVIVGRKSFLARNPWAAASTAITLVTLLRSFAF
jgi:protein involved in polysaccharide export with SLBB domain